MSIGDSKSGVNNFCAVFGSQTHENVKAKSTLAAEIKQLFVLKMMNFWQEVKFPDCFLNFRGEQGKNSIQGDS